MEPVNAKNAVGEIGANTSLNNKQHTDYQPNSVKSENKSVDKKTDTENLNDEQLFTVADNINSFLKSIQTDMQVEIHKATNTAIFRIIKRDDKTVISEVPASKLLDIEAKISEMVGSLLDANI